jgi:uncharacterized membrane protein
MWLRPACRRITAPCDLPSHSDAGTFAAFRMTAVSRHVRAARIAVLTLAAGYATFFSLHTVLWHERFRTYAFDLGTFDQGIWLAGRSEGLFVTVRGLHLLGDHVRMISFFLAPMYWIWDDVRALLILQSVVIAIGGALLWRIAIRELPSHPWFAAAVSASYLLHPAVGNLNLDHAHPDAFATTLLFASIDFLRSRRRLAFWIAMALAMACKEDVPLVFGALGLVLMLDPKERRFGFAVSAVAGAYFLLCMLVILPAFNGVGFFRTGKGGFLYSLGNNMGDPLWIVKQFLRPANGVYLFQVGVGLLFLFLLSPLWIVPAVPALVANMLSDAQYMRSLDWHYQTSILPFFYFATVMTVAKWTKGGRPLVARAVAAALVVAAVVTNLEWSKAPIDRAEVVLNLWKEVQTDPKVAKIRAILDMIPPDARVSADYTMVPQLTHRKYVYMYPNPFRVSNWGILGENTHDPATIDYIILRSLKGHDFDPELVAHLVNVNSFEKIAGDADISLYRRVARTEVHEQAGCGDWNGDGTVSRDDARQIGEAIMQGRNCPPSVCDADGDGELKYADVLRIGQKVADPATALACPAAG